MKPKWNKPFYKLYSFFGRFKNIYSSAIQLKTAYSNTDLWLLRDQAQSDCVRNSSIDLELKGFQSGYKINRNQPTQSYHGLACIFAVLAIFSYLGFNDMSDLGILYLYYIRELLYCTRLKNFIIIKLYYY